MLSKWNLDLKLLFRIAKEKGKEIEGDFVSVFKKKDHIEFNTGLHTAFLLKGKEVIFQFTPKDGSLMKKLEIFLRKNRLTQGYITCNSGTLSDMRCAFFLTKNKPSPTFSKAFFKGKNKIISISGFFLMIPTIKDGRPISKVVPHVHVVFQNNITAKIFSGHLEDAQSGDIKLKIIPLSGKLMKRETDPNTGGMYLRTDKKEDDKPTVGETMLFAFGPHEDFPNKLFKLMSNYQIKKAKYSFAVGTLWSVYLKDQGKEKMVSPTYGLELSLTTGEVTFDNKRYFHNTNVHLTDRYGKQYKGRLISGKVKDILEGALEIVS